MNVSCPHRGRRRYRWLATATRCLELVLLLELLDRRNQGGREGGLGDCHATGKTEREG